MQLKEKSIENPKLRFSSTGCYCAYQSMLSKQTFSVQKKYLKKEEETFSTRSTIVLIHSLNMRRYSHKQCLSSASGIGKNNLFRIIWKLLSRGNSEKKSYNISNNHHCNQHQVLLKKEGDKEELNRHVEVDETVKEGRGGDSRGLAIWKSITNIKLIRSRVLLRCPCMTLLLLKLCSVIRLDSKLLTVSNLK